MVTKLRDTDGCERSDRCLFTVGFVTDGAGEKSLLMILMTHETQMEGRKQRAAKAETEESQRCTASLDAIARGKCEHKVTTYAGREVLEPSLMSFKALGRP